METSSSGTVLASTTYVRDLMGNPTKVTDKAGVATSHTFDARNQLTAVCYKATSCTGATDFIKYGYDGSGNVTSETRPTGTTSFAYDDNDQLTGTTGLGGTGSYTYDADGNRLTDPTSSYVVNAAGQTTSTTTAGVATSSKFDGNGLLVSTTKAGAVTSLDYDPLTLQLAGERNGSSVTRAYTYGRELVALTASAKDTYYSTDDLGSVTATRTSAAAAQRGYVYEPYGKIKSQTAASGSAANPLGFTGGYSADSGATVRLGVRTYAPSAVSFTTPDQGGTADAYRYASGNPATLTDQLGLYSWSNFAQDVNKVSGYVATGAQLVAVGCAVAVVCAPLVPIAGGIALAGTAVNAASGVAMATQTCASQKGSCAGAVGVAAFGLLGSRFGGGKLLGSVDDVAGRIGRDIPFGPASEDAWAVLNRVDAKGAPLAGYKGGKSFLNDGSQGAARLPKETTYREWDLAPKVKGVPRDGRRLVTGLDGSAYYTTNHYLSFIQIR